MDSCQTVNVGATTGYLFSMDTSTCSQEEPVFGLLTLGFIDTG